MSVLNSPKSSVKLSILKDLREGPDFRTASKGISWLVRKMKKNFFLVPLLSLC